jgi:hypothetical protein
VRREAGLPGRARTHGLRLRGHGGYWHTEDQRFHFNWTGLRSNGPWTACDGQMIAGRFWTLSECCAWAAGVLHREREEQA